MKTYWKVIAATSALMLFFSLAACAAPVASQTDASEDPASQQAVEQESHQPAEDEAQGVFADLAVGDSIDDFGGYSWNVLAIEDGKALVITQDVIDLRAFNDTDQEVTWADCTLRTWLNGVFYSDSFDAEEQALILETKLDNSNASIFDSDGILYESNTAVSGGADTTDRVFILSAGEATQYFSANGDDHKAQQARVAKQNIPEANIADAAQRYLAHMQAVAGSNIKETDLDYYIESLQKSQGDKTAWLLRSPGTTASEVSFVNIDGKIYPNPVFRGDGTPVSYVSDGIRPAVWISLE